MQVMHNRNAHHLPCNKTSFLVKTLEINNNMAILIHPEQANSTIAKKCDNRNKQIPWIRGFWSTIAPELANTCKQQSQSSIYSFTWPVYNSQIHR